MKAPVDLITLGPGHREEAASLLAEAFLDDPDVAAIVKGGVQKRRRIMKAHYRNLISLFLPYRRSRLAMLNGSLVGVMLFFAPHEEPATPLVMLKFLVKMLLRSGWGIVRRGWTSANDDEKHRPLEPHYYLSMLAVDPRHQGRRIGSAFLSYLTAMADRERTLIYLSSTNPKAIPLYRRFGFETTSVTSPLGVPNHHMERKPQPIL